MYEHRNYQFKHPYSSVTPEMLRRYATKVFVETGTNIGLGVAAALEAGCFERVVSFENDPALHRCALALYGRMTPWVKLVFQDSDAGLRDLCPGLLIPCTFYLDAHAEDHCPLLWELEAIATSPCNEHIIMIDDVRMFGSAAWQGVTFDQIAQWLRRINPRYQFTYEDTQNARQDLLVAQVRA